MTYQVSTNTAGEHRWWTERENVPMDHVGIRVATDNEAELMGRMLRAKDSEMDGLGTRLAKMLAEYEPVLI